MPAHNPTPDIFKIITSNQRYFVFYRFALDFLFAFIHSRVCVRISEEDMEYQNEQLNGEKSKISQSHRDINERSQSFALRAVSHCAKNVLFMKITYFVEAFVAGLKAWSADLIEKKNHHRRRLYEKALNLSWCLQCSWHLFICIWLF